MWCHHSHTAMQVDTMKKCMHAVCEGCSTQIQMCYDSQHLAATKPRSSALTVMFSHVANGHSLSNPIKYPEKLK